MRQVLTTPEPRPVDPNCAACAAPAPAYGAGYWWLHGRRWHAGCAPWGGRPFPFTWALDEGRRVLAKLRREGAEPSDKLVRAVTFLRTAAKSWPPAEPAPLLERAGLAAAVVQHWCLALKAEREALARPPSTPAGGRRPPHGAQNSPG